MRIYNLGGRNVRRSNKIILIVVVFGCFNHSGWVVFAANIIFVIIILFCNSKGLWVYYCGMTEDEDVFSIYPATEFELK